MTFYLTQEQEHLLFLKTCLSLKLTACQEKRHDCPEWARGGATQQELGSQVLGAMQGGVPGLRPGQGDPPQTLLQTEEVAPAVRSHFGSLLGLIRWGGGEGRRKGSGAMSIQEYVNGKCLARAYLGI